LKWRILVAGISALLSAVCACAQIAPAHAQPAVPATIDAAPASVPQAGDRGVLTLDEAVAEAQQNNRQIKIAFQNVLYSNDAILAAKTQRYPQFNVQLTAGGLLTAVNVQVPEGVFGQVGTTPVPSQNSVITTQPHFTALSLVQVYQPLSQLYQVHLNVELMEAGKQLSQEQLRQQKQEITDSVKSSYYTLLQTQSALDAARENVKALHEMDRTTDEYVAQKAALPYQASGVKAQLAQAELQEVTLEDTIQTQKENLNDLMGRDITTDFALAGVPDALPEEQSLDLARQTALDNRTEIKQAQNKIEQATLARRLEKANYIPQVGLQYMYFRPFTIEGLPSGINSVGFSLKWDIWDWGNKRQLMD
jgi:outer membrane protein